MPSPILQRIRRQLLTLLQERNRRVLDWLCGEPPSTRPLRGRELFHPELPTQLAVASQELPESSSPGVGVLTAAVFQQWIARSLSDSLGAFQNDLRDKKLTLEDESSVAALDAMTELRGEKEPTRRRAIYDLFAKVGFRQSLTEGMLRAHFDLAEKFGFSDPISLHERCLDSQLEALDQLALGILRKTRDVYADVASWLARKRLGMGLDDVTPADLPYLLAGDVSVFPVAERRSLLTAAGHPLGFDPTGAGSIEHYDGDGGKMPAASGVVVFGPPTRVCLVHRPGPGYWNARSHLSKLARCWSICAGDPRGDFGQVCLESPTHANSAELLFWRLTSDVPFLSLHTDSDIKGLSFAANAADLFLLRKAAARLHFDLLLFDSRSVEGKLDLYSEVMRTSLLVETEPYGSLDDFQGTFLASADRFRAWIFSAMLRTHLVHYFDVDWFRNPRAGTFLSKLWRNDGKESMASALGSIDFQALRISDLVDHFDHVF